MCHTLDMEPHLLVVKQSLVRGVLAYFARPQTLDGVRRRSDDDVVFDRSCCDHQTLGGTSLRSFSTMIFSSQSLPEQRLAAIMPRAFKVDAPAC